MYLHRLSLRAIGPFAGEYSIDFAELGKSGLFLLEGPTGAGKSTIIDAIVFALYGSLAGSESSSDRMHSHHAKPDAEPYVELVFETAEGIFRVRRTPSFLRPKRTGVGFTTQNPSAKLESLVEPQAAAGTVISTSIQEASSEVIRIVGLSKTQFVQTVVLPQGEFAHFLRSTGEERRAVLQSLFGTEIYEETTKQLIEMRRVAQRAVDDAHAQSELLLASFREASGKPDADVEAGRQWVIEAAGIATTSAETLAQVNVEAEAARQELDKQRALASALTTKAALEGRALASQARADEVTDLRDQIALAREASNVEGVLTNFRLAEKRRAASAAALERAIAEASDAPTDPLDRITKRDALQAELGKLEELESTELGLPQRVQSTADEQTALLTIEQDIEREANEQTLRPAARVLIVQERTVQLAAAGDLGAAEAALTHAEAQLGSLDQLAVLDERVANAERVERACIETAESAVGSEANIRLAKIKGMAGELAEQLRDGEPCSVCGSLQHPSPASIEADHPSDEDLAEAEQIRVQAEADLIEARAALSSRSGARDAARESLGEVDREGATVQRDEASGRVENAKRAARSVLELDGRLGEFDDESELLRDTLATVRLDHAARGAQLKAEKTGLRKDQLKIAKVLANRASSVAELIETITGQKEALEALIENYEADRSNAADLGTRGAEVILALGGTSFASIEAAEAAIVDAALLDEKVSVVDEFDLELQAIEIGRSAPNVRALTGGETADVETAEGRVADFDVQVKLAAATAAVAAQVSARSSETFANFENGQIALQEAIDVSTPIIRMADIAAGVSPANPKAVSLSTYVLMRRFEDVIAAANTRLALMSSGRYSLEPSDEKELGSRSRKLGLSLVIRDHETDTTRDPKSFSGGETFYASLSLALGLADVVQGEAGGVEIGTLFVDEGFGSLDPERLDTVMTELGRLSAGGRTVGIVSHVEELKQRIADRIEVRALSSGGSSFRSTLDAAGSVAA
jgi:DNA repair protein SbcC/Rad50